jgi:hypothetical protein
MSMNLKDYNTFLDALSFDPSDRVCLGFSSGKGDWQNVFYTFVDLVSPQVIQDITARNAAGKNVYISMAPFTPESVQRTKENVQAVRHLFIEKDEKAAETLAQIDADVKAGVIPQPAIILESSPDKLQVIWTMDSNDFLLPDGKPDIAKHEREIDALQYRYQSDPASTDSARVLRIAGTINHKYETAPVVKVLSATNFPALFRSDEFKIDQKPVTAKPEILRDERNLIPHGQIYGAVMSQIGKLRQEGYPPETVETMIPEWVEYNCAAPIDWDKIASYTKAAYKFDDGVVGAQVLFGGKPGKTTLSEESDAAEYADLDHPLTDRERSYIREMKQIYAEMFMGVGQLAKSADQKAQESAAAITWRDSFRTLDQMERGEIRMLIPGVLPEGITYIGGLSADGKTWFALSLVRALTTGEPFLGKYPVPERIPVLYLIPEVGDRAFGSRGRKMGIPVNDPAYFLARTVSMGATLRLDDPIILEAVRQMKPVIFLDTSIRFSTAADENSAAQNKKLVDDIVGLRAAGAVGVIGLHHSIKNLRKEAMTLENVLRGSGDLAAMTDMVFGVKLDVRLAARQTGPIELDIEVVKSRDLENPPEPFRIALKYKAEDGRIRSHINDHGDVKLVSTAETLRENEDAVVVLVTEQPYISADDISAKTGISKYRVKKILDEAHFHKNAGNNGTWVKETPEEKAAREAKPVAKPVAALSKKALKRIAGEDVPEASTIDLNAK